eukprot:403357176
MVKRSYYKKIRQIQRIEIDNETEQLGLPINQAASNSMANPRSQVMPTKSRQRMINSDHNNYDQESDYKVEQEQQYPLIFSPKYLNQYNLDLLNSPKKLSKKPQLDKCMFDPKSQFISSQINDLRNSDLQKNYPQHANQTKRGCSRNIDTFSIPQKVKCRDASSSSKNLSYNTQAQKKQSSTGQDQIIFQLDFTSDNSDTFNFNDKDMNATQKLKTQDSIQKNNQQNRPFITSPKPKEQRFFIQTPTLSASRGRLIDFEDSSVSQNQLCSQQQFANLAINLCNQYSQRESDLRQSKLPELQKFNKSEDSTNIKKELEILKSQLINLQFKLSDLETKVKD